MRPSHAAAPVTVAPADPGEAGAAALLAASHALMQTLFAPEENFHLDIAALRGPDIRFFAAFDGDTCLGTGALALRDGYGEVKSMFVAENARGRGVADAILRRLEDEARAQGLASLKLETGTGLDAAQRLYARHGFTRCGPFGSYPDAPPSVFMQKPV
ncbi:MAG: GNAT family N-acetyltransferase [Roseovarius sp.]